MILTTAKSRTLRQEVTSTRSDCILLAFLSFYLSSRPSRSWKRNGSCGRRDLQQTPRRLCLVALGRSALWSPEVYEEPVVEYCTRCRGPIKYDCCTQTWDLWVKPSTVVLEHRQIVGSGLLSSLGNSGALQAWWIWLELLHWHQIKAAENKRVPGS